jgi:hypothetical protein
MVPGSEVPVHRATVPATPKCFLTGPGWRWQGGTSSSRFDQSRTPPQPWVVGAGRERQIAPLLLGWASG